MADHRLLAVALGVATLAAAGAASAWSSFPPMEIELGAVVDGSLEFGDNFVGANDSDEGPQVEPPFQYYELYVVQVQAGQCAVATMTSADFDSSLAAHSGVDMIVEVEDRYGAGTASTVRFTAPADGPYYLKAGSFSAGETGDYRLTVVQRPAADCPPAHRP